MKTITSSAELDKFHGCAFVPTMGALHQGHASLISAAKKTGLPFVVSIFVNPKQFGPHEDLAQYPRTLDSDLKLCASLGVDAVFAPSVEEIYPDDEVVEVISPGPLGEKFEGAARPGHFEGVLTVVHRLFQLVQPRVAVFGKKDRQQLVLIKQMVEQRDMDIEVVEGETVRDSDGLALSSRNRFLSPEGRNKALALPKALATGSIVAGAKELQGLDVDYFVLTDQHLNPVDSEGSEPAIILGAVRIDGVRLIDNMDVVQR